VFDRRTRVSDLIREARRDLAYRPRMRYGYRTIHAMRRAVPVISVLVVAVLVTDLLILTQLQERRSEAVSLRGAVAVPSASPTTQPVRGAQSGKAEARPTQAAAPSPVAPLTSIRRPHLFIVANKPLSSAVVAKITQAKGVQSVERADAAEVMLDGKRVQTLGVNPSTFRAYTPKPTAGSDRLWRNVSAGEVAVSFVLGNDGGMPLGKTFTTAGRHLRVGAYATMGMGAIDAVVSKTTARALGIPQNNALVVSAPQVDSVALRRTLLRVLPRGGQIAVINPVLKAPETPGRTAPEASGRTVWPADAFLAAPQMKTVLLAAASKLGRPYVWGAEGPDTFDCSGLVQWAYAQAGITVPRVTHQQFVSGPQIPLEQAQPGDLLFWRSDPTNPGYVSHVAIYWGDGKMLHAPRTGDVVKIVPVSTRNFAGAVRISPGVAAQVR
jgi:cell wall-associated NlpC family hydrolase